jgi:hypothetical protein
VAKGGKYACADVCDSIYTQVYLEKTFPKTDDAVAATSGQVLMKGAKLVFAEYSAEHGAISATGIQDLLCSGEERLGHGRGMCQWGSQRWSNDGRDHGWILAHYYSDSTLVDGIGLESLSSEQPPTPPAAPSPPAPPAPAPSSPSSGTAGSCAGMCGSMFKWQDCYCDSQCTKMTPSDCCSDYQERCGSSAPPPAPLPPAPVPPGLPDPPLPHGVTKGYCDGHCGADQLQVDCYCDTICTIKKDCCSDYKARCLNAEDPVSPPPPPPPDKPAVGSCAGKCGVTTSVGGCYCDSTCEQFSPPDCCGDYESICKQVPPPLLPSTPPDPPASAPTQGSCVGACGTSTLIIDCHCDDLCLLLGDCCADHASICLGQPNAPIPV